MFPAMQHAEVKVCVRVATFNGRVTCHVNGPYFLYTGIEICTSTFELVVQH